MLLFPRHPISWPGASGGDNPEWRRSVTGADTRFQATLHGIQPGPKLITLYDQHHKQGFGRDPDLLCPYAIDRDAPEGPRCGIWQQRNGVCSTFFCKHVKGLTGYQFWQTMRGLLGQLENALAWWAILELIDAPDRVFSAGARRAGDRNAVLIAPDAWRFWPGTREASSRACAERAEALDPAEAVAIRAGRPGCTGWADRAPPNLRRNPHPTCGGVQRAPAEAAGAPPSGYLRRALRAGCSSPAALRRRPHTQTSNPPEA